MFDKWLKIPAHYYLHLTALLILVIGVSVTNVLMSIGTIWLISNWVLEGGFNQKLALFKSNKLIWTFILLFLFAALSLLWSDDINYGVHDLRIKLPFIVIPLVLGTSTYLGNKELTWLIYAFISGLLITSIINYIQFSNSDFPVQDSRNMSYFISHIRYSILINLGVFLSGYLLIKNKAFYFIPIILWFLFYLDKSQTITGYGLFSLLCLSTIIYFISLIKNKFIKWTILGLGASFTLMLSMFLFNTNNHKTDSVDYDSLALYTKNNNGYYHIKNSQITEDGHFVYLYISEKECRNAWQKRSVIKFDSLDIQGQPIQSTVYRYMTSKNLRKDSIGFTKLSDKDIVNIENGITNYQVGNTISRKLNSLKIQLLSFQSNGDPNGHSLLQRRIHIKTAFNILHNNWLFGVGIGDVQKAFNKQYQQNETNLIKENWHRSHNQFLTYWISHGIFGITLITLVFFIPFKKLYQTIDYLQFIVLITFFFCFFWQDILETQAGVTIFSLFYGLVIFKMNTNGKN